MRAALRHRQPRAKRGATTQDDGKWHHCSLLQRRRGDCEALCQTCCTKIGLVGSLCMCFSVFVRDFGEYLFFFLVYVVISVMLNVKYIIVLSAPTLKRGELCAAVGQTCCTKKGGGASPQVSQVEIQWEQPHHTSVRARALIASCYRHRAQSQRRFTPQHQTIKRYVPH